MFIVLHFEYAFRYFREQLRRTFTSHSFLLSLGAEARFRAQQSSHGSEALVASEMAAGSAHSDFRVRPPAFGGESDKFQDFHFKFRAYVALTERQAERLLDAAETSEQEIDDEHLGFGQHGVSDEHLRARQDFSRKLFFILVTITDRAPLLIVQSVTSGNGLSLIHI